MEVGYGPHLLERCLGPLAELRPHRTKFAIKRACLRAPLDMSVSYEECNRGNCTEICTTSRKLGKITCNPFSKSS